MAGTIDPAFIVAIDQAFIVIIAEELKKPSSIIVIDYYSMGILFNGALQEGLILLLINF